MATAALALILLCGLGYLTAQVWRTWVRNQTREATVVLVALIAIISLVYSVEFLDLKVGGSYASLEKIQKAQQEVQATKEEVSKIARLLLKSSVIAGVGSRQFGGISRDLMKKLEDHA